MPEDMDPHASPPATPPPPPPPWHGPFAHHAYSPPPAVYSLPGAPQPGFYPLTLGRAVRLSFSLFRFGWRTFFAIGLFMAIPVAIIEGVVEYVTFDSITAWQRAITGSPFGPRPDPQTVVAALPASTLAVIILSSLLIAPFVTLGGAALVHAIATAIGGQQLSARKSFNVAIGRIPSLIGLFLVLAVGSLGASAVGYLTPLLSSVMAALGVAGGPVALLGLIVFVALTFLLIFVVIRLAFALETLILEQLPLMAALRRSWSLLSGSMLRLIGWMFVFSIIVGLIGIAFEIPAMIVALIISPPRLTDLGSLSSPFGANFAVTIGVVGGLVGVLLQTLVMTGTVLLYFDIRFRHGEQVPAPGQPAAPSSTPAY
jgi:hypothetical protein